MKKLFIPFFILLTVSLFAQERISSIMGDGNNENYLFREYNGEKYVIKYNSFDSVKVYKYVTNKIQFQHATYIPGISYTGFTLHSFHSKILKVYIFVSGYAHYNFVENKLIDTINGKKINGIISSHNDDVLMTFSDSTTTRNTYNVNMSTGNTKLLSPNYNYHSQNASYYVIIKNDSTYFIEDKNTGDLDSISFNSGQANSYLLNDQYMCFLSGQRIYSYEFFSGSVQEVENLGAYDPYKVEFKDFNTFYIIRVYSKNQKQKLLFFNSDHQLKNSTDLKVEYIYPQKFKNGVLLFGFNEFNYFDLNSGLEKLTLSGIYNHDFIVLKDRYIVHKYIYELVIYDVDLDTTYFTGANTWLASENFQYFDLGNDIYLLNYSNGADGYKEIFDLDLSKLEIKDSQYIENDISGLDSRSIIKKIGNDLFMLGKNIYHINGDSTILVNEYNTLQNIDYTNFKIIEDQLYWVEKTSTTFDMYKFENGGKQKYFSYPSIPTQQFVIPLNVRDYYPVGDFTVLFTNGIESKSLLGNNLTNTISDLSNDGSLDFQNQVIRFQNNLYCIKEKVLFRIDENFVMHEIGNINGFLSSFTLFNDELYLMDNSAFYKVKNDGLETILFDLSFGTIEYVGEYIMISDLEKYYIYDGVNVITNNATNNEQSYQHFYKDIFKTYNNTGIPNEFKLELRNLKTNTIYNLPNYIEDLRAVTLFKYKDRYVYLGSNSGISQTVFVYETDSLLSSFSFVKSFSTTSRNLQPIFINYNNEGLLYAGTEIFLMDDNLNFVHLDVKGDENANDIELKDGYFYFKGIDPTLGRQVYRVQVFSQRVSTKDVNNSVESLTIYPNPSNGIVNIKNNHGYVQLYNSSGTPLQGGNSTIDLSSLISGWYILRDEKGNTAKLVKQ